MPPGGIVFPVAATQKKRFGVVEQTKSPSITSILAPAPAGVNTSSKDGKPLNVTLPTFLTTMLNVQSGKHVLPGPNFCARSSVPATSGMLAQTGASPGRLTQFLISFAAVPAPSLKLIGSSMLLPAGSFTATT